MDPETTSEDPIKIRRLVGGLNKKKKKQAKKRKREIKKKINKE